MAEMFFGAIEAGGTKFRCAVADAAGNLVAEARIATTEPTPTLAQVAAFFAEQHTQGRRCAAFGIAAFGPIDLHPESPGYGHLLATPKPGWSGVDLVGPLARRFACPVAIDTDVNAAALAEATLGAGRGCDTVVYVTIGTGIGGGIAIRGRTQRGALHPEMGHIRVPRHALDQSFRGTCPFHGDCLEGLASGPAIVARYGAPLDRLAPDHQALSVVSYYLGQLASNVILLLSPERLIFGGGVMTQPALLDGTRRATAELLNGYAGLGDPAALASLITAPDLGTGSGLLGAVLLARAALKAS
jgi:fructokinase